MGDRDMSEEDLIESGFLQEANRLFFHPRGLALTVIKHDNGYTELVVSDYRDENDGIIFSEEVDLNRRNSRLRKKVNVHKEFAKQAKRRMQEFGYIIQPLK